MDNEIKQYDPGIWEHYEDVSQNRDQVAARAELLSLDPIFADAFTLQLDLDTKEAEDHYHHQWNWFQCQLGYLLEENAVPVEMKSKSGHMHVSIKLAHPLEATERLLLQALLGSDLKRELLNYTRLKVKGEDLTCFFRPRNLMLPAGLQVTHVVDNPRPEPLFLVVDTDNHGSDYPDERFVSELLPRPAAEEIAKKRNEGVNDNSPRWFKVVQAGYELKPEFQP